MTRRLRRCERFLARIWDAFKTLPGIRHIGHGVAVVLGIYRLDRWLTERECRADLALAGELAAAGMPGTADRLRVAAVERLAALRKDGR